MFNKFLDVPWNEQVVDCIVETDDEIKLSTTCDSTCWRKKTQKKLRLISNSSFTYAKLDKRYQRNKKYEKFHFINTKCTVDLNFFWKLTQDGFTILILL